MFYSQTLGLIKEMKRGLSPKGVLCRQINFWDASLAVWHLPGGPVGPASMWATTSNVKVGQTTYPVNRGRV